MSELNSIELCIERYRLNNIVKSALQNKSACAIVGFDIEKACDTVHRPTLLHKLENYNISGLAQGGCLSGILFSIMINDLPTAIKHSHPCLYADDTQIAKQVSPKNNSE